VFVRNPDSFVEIRTRISLRSLTRGQIVFLDKPAAAGHHAGSTRRHVVVEVSHVP